MTKDLIELWYSDATVRGMATSTIYSDSRNLRNFETYITSIGKDIATADRIDMRGYVEYLRKKGLATSTIRNHLNALNSFYEFMIFEGYRNDNPVIGIRSRYLASYKTDGESHTHKLISVEEAAQLVDACVDVRDKAMLVTMFKTGVRKGELLRMEIRDIDWKENSILLKPTKKRSNRIVFFDDETARVLRWWVNIRETRYPFGPALWIAPWGRPISRGSLDNTIRKAAVLCGLHNPSSDRMEDHFSAHCCRHWLVTHLLRSGMRRDYVKWIRGDAMKEAIDLYYHVDPEDVRKSYLTHVPHLGI